MSICINGEIPTEKDKSTIAYFLIGTGFGEGYVVDICHTEEQIRIVLDQKYARDYVSTIIKSELKFLDRLDPADFIDKSLKFDCNKGWIKK